MAWSELKNGKRSQAEEARDGCSVVVEGKHHASNTGQHPNNDFQCSPLLPPGYDVDDMVEDGYPDDTNAG